MEEFDCQIVYIMILKTKGTKTAIENARQTSKKKSNGQGKKSSDNIIKFMGEGGNNCINDLKY